MLRFQAFGLPLSLGLPSASAARSASAWCRRCCSSGLAFSRRRKPVLAIVVAPVIIALARQSSRRHAGPGGHARSFRTVCRFRGPRGARAGQPTPRARAGRRPLGQSHTHDQSKPDDVYMRMHTRTRMRAFVCLHACLLGYPHACVHECMNA